MLPRWRRGGVLRLAGGERPTRRCWAVARRERRKRLLNAQQREWHHVEAVGDQEIAAGPGYKVAAGDGGGGGSGGVGSVGRGRSAGQHPPDGRAGNGSTSGSTFASVLGDGTGGKGVRIALPRGSVGAAGGHDTHAGRRRAAAAAVTAKRPTAPVPSSAVYTAHPLWSTNPPVSVSLASTGRPG